MPTRGAVKRGAARRLFESYLEAFVQDLRARRCSRAWEICARSHLPQLFSHLRDRGIRDPRQVSEEDLVSFAGLLATKPSQRGRPFSPATRCNYLGTVRCFFAFLERTGVILANPALHLHLPRAASLPRRILSEAQACRLVEIPSVQTPVGLRNRGLLETLYGTGIRLAECFRLDVMDVDLDEGTLLVRSGKGRKDRLLPLPGRAAAALDVYLRDSRPRLVRDPREPALLLSRDGRRLRPISIQFVVRWHAERAGIPRRVSPHVLRHACATHLLRGGADVRHIQELLGHANLETTSPYTRVEIKDLKPWPGRIRGREPSGRRLGVGRPHR